MSTFQKHPGKRRMPRFKPGEDYRWECQNEDHYGEGGGHWVLWTPCGLPFVYYRRMINTLDIVVFSEPFESINDGLRWLKSMADIKGGERVGEDVCLELEDGGFDRTGRYAKITTLNPDSIAGHGHGKYFAHFGLRGQTRGWREADSWVRAHPAYRMREEAHHRGAGTDGETS